jgi:hypothetical protein
LQPGLIRGSTVGITTQRFLEVGHVGKSWIFDPAGE